MNRVPQSMIVIMLLTPLLATPSRAQELPRLGQAVEQQLASARAAVRGLALYPKETREAVLEISQHPPLVAKLANVEDASSLESVLAEYPAEVQQAGRLLVRTPEVIATMRAHPVVTTIVGKAYARQKDAIKQLADRLHGEMSEAEADAVDAWAERLAENSAATEQLMQAAQMLLQELTAAAQQGGQSYPEEYTAYPEQYADPGAAATTTGAAVYAVPTGALAEYVLANADQYSELASTIVNHWLSDITMEYFSGAVADRIGRYEEAFGEGFLQDKAKLRENLRDAAKVEKRAREQLKSRAASDLRNVARNHAQEFPGLANQLQSSARRPPGIGRSASQKLQPRTAARRPPLNARPSVQPPRARPTNVTRRPPTRSQQMARANMAHRSNWSGSRGGRPQGGRSGGGRSRGGRRR